MIITTIGCKWRHEEIGALNVQSAFRGGLLKMESATSEGIEWNYKIWCAVLVVIVLENAQKGHGGDVGLLLCAVCSPVYVQRGQARHQTSINVPIWTKSEPSWSSFSPQIVAFGLCPFLDWMQNFGTAFLQLVLLKQSYSLAFQTNSTHLRNWKQIWKTFVLNQVHEHSCEIKCKVVKLHLLRNPQREYKSGGQKHFIQKHT